MRTAAGTLRQSVPSGSETRHEGGRRDVFLPGDHEPRADAGEDAELTGPEGYLVMYVMSLDEASDQEPGQVSRRRDLGVARGDYKVGAYQRGGTRRP